MLSIFKEYTTAQAIIRKRYDLVFYAEHAAYYQYYRALIEALKGKGLSICYITSDAKDPVLNETDGLEPCYIRNTLAFLFPRLQARLMILTMPDLQQFHLKRSAGVGKYIYLFHALVSIHQQYRAHAFDQYDAFFCAGPHHVAELRESEALYGLSLKELIPFGYPLLQELKHKAAMQPPGKEKTILVAPSWYPEGILRTCARPLLEELPCAGYRIILRPHPEFVRRFRKEHRQLEALAAQKGNILFDKNPSLMASLLEADFLVTDRSGIAFEFAFAKGRPVLFIDTPLKLQNPECGRYRHEPVENSFRAEIGIQLQTNRLSDIMPALRELEGELSTWREKIRKAESRLVYPAQNFTEGLAYVSSQLQVLL